MLTTEEQIEDINRLCVLKSCWDAPLGMASGQMIINNRWYVPISYIADICGMSAVELLEHHIFAGGLNADYIGTLKFIKSKIGNEFQCSISSTLLYENGDKVYINGSIVNPRAN